MIPHIGGLFNRYCGARIQARLGRDSGFVVWLEVAINGDGLDELFAVFSLS